MRTELLVIVLALLFAVSLAACGDDTTNEGGGDAVEADAGDTTGTDGEGEVNLGPCQEDIDCADFVYCNGKERCLPDDPAADERGCVSGTPPATEDADPSDCYVPTCDEDVNQVIYVPVVEGSPCEDTIPCTSSGTCDASGVCTGVPDDEACDDGVFCNGAERCDPAHGEAGFDGCAPGTPPASGEIEGCLVTTCDEASASIQSVPVVDGTVCSDDDPCTKDDVCQAGICGGTALECQASAPCLVASCDPTTGECTEEPAEDGTACDDGSLCTTGDACIAGICDGQLVVCATDEPCAVAVCVEATGECATEQAPDGTTCDDGVTCTVGDACQAGVCQGTTDDAGCSDGEYCNGQEVCAPDDLDADDDGCLQGTLVVVVDPDPTDCVVPVCDEVTDAVVEVAADDGASCQDGVQCTQDDTCQAGVCQGTADDAVCQDGSYCTGHETCAPTAPDADALGCVPGIPPTPPTDEPCHTYTCDDATENFVSVPADEGGACDDGAACSSGGTCLAGACVGTPDHEACDDGAFCNGQEQCAPLDPTADADGCVPGVPPEGGDDPIMGDCMVMLCDEDSDTFSLGPAPDGYLCDDGVACTMDDSCSAGECAGTPSPAWCQDGVFCNGEETCEPTSPSSDADGCVAGAPPSPPDDADPLDCMGYVCDEGSDGFVPAPASDGDICDDGVPCTESDQCTAGVCVGTASHEACADGVFCNGEEACDPTAAEADADGCVAGTPPVPPADDDPTDCLVPACDEATGGFVAVGAPDGTTCDDGVPCTVGDACLAGACDGVADDASCDDTLFCNGAETCVPTSALADAAGCVAGTPPTSPDPAPFDCVDLVCNEETDGWDEVTRPYGTPCNDSAPCTEGDTCDAAGLCQGYVLVGWCDDGVFCNGEETCAPLDPAADDLGCIEGAVPTITDPDPTDCLAYSCNEATHGFDPVPISDGTSCDDGLACTTFDSCSGGACDGVPDDDLCVDDEYCDGVESCEPTNSLADGAGCVPGVPPTHTDPDELDCVAYTCDEASDTFVEIPEPDSTPCDDGVSCTGSDTCLGGVCKGLVPDHAACDDDAFCNGQEQCAPSNPLAGADGCVPGTVPTGPTDPDPTDCSTFACDEDLDAFVPAEVAEGSPCDDLVACTMDEVCYPGGLCIGDTPEELCSDGLFCNGEEVCAPNDPDADADGCAPGDPPAGTDVDPDDCLVPVCDETTDSFAMGTADDYSGCDDLNPCTEDDHCLAGACSGDVITCESPGGCLEGVCDPADGTCGYTQLAEGTPCSDGLYCVEEGLCDASGVCVAAAITCPTETACDEESWGCACPAGQASDPSAPDGPCVPWCIGHEDHFLGHSQTRGWALTEGSDASCTVSFDDADSYDGLLVGGGGVGTTCSLVKEGFVFEDGWVEVSWIPLDGLGETTVAVRSTAEGTDEYLLAVDGTGFVTWSRLEGGSEAVLFQGYLAALGLDYASGGTYGSRWTMRIGLEGTTTTLAVADAAGQWRHLATVEDPGGTALVAGSVTMGATEGHGPVLGPVTMVSCPSPPTGHAMILGNDGRISAPVGASQGSYTVELWTQLTPADLVPGAHYLLVTGSLGAVSPASAFVRVDGGVPACGYLGPALAEEVITAPQGLSASTWHHLVCSYDEAAARLTLFVDGAAVAIAGVGAPPLAWPTSTTVGSLPDGTSGIAGLVDEVRLSESVVYTGDFEPSRRLEALPSTVALYHLDEAAGPSILDASGGGNHATALDGFRTPTHPWCSPDAITGRCLVVDAAPTTWSAAREACRALGGELAAPAWDMASDALTGTLADVDVWLGVTDPKGLDVWARSDGAPLSWAPWSTGQPNLPGGVAGCVRTFPTGSPLAGLWDDASCGQTRGFVCQLVLSAGTRAPLPGDLVINEVLLEPAATDDTNGDGATGTDDEQFVELVNRSSYDLELGACVLVVEGATVHVVPPATVLPASNALVIFGGGAPIPVEATVVTTASTGALGLPTTGAEVVLECDGTPITTVTLPASPGAGTSWTMSPDCSEDMVSHGDADGSGGMGWSPGTVVYGEPFDHR